MFEKKVPNPLGNPNIATTRKTGPRTDIGKLKTVIASTSVSGLTIKNETPLLKRIRQCDKCPLGEKLISMRVDKKIIQRIKPSECGEYKKGKTECIVPVTGWVEKVKLFWMLEKDTFELQRVVILDALAKATTASEVETIKKGYAGFYAKEWTEIGLKYLSEYNKLISGVSDKHLHLHQHEKQGDMAERIVEKIFKEEEKDGKENR